MGTRKPSATSIVPRDHPEVEMRNEEYPPEDARGMSPRRNSEDLEKLGQETRRSLKAYVDPHDACTSLGISTLTSPRQAKTLQSSLAALAERIDEVKSDHDKLESENKFLQDYIGGLTRTMSKSDLHSSTGPIKRKK